MLLNHFTIFIIQCRIKIGTPVRWQIFFKKVCFEPDGFTGQVRFFVEVNMYFFLRKIGAIQVYTVLNGLGT